MLTNLTHFGTRRDAIRYLPRCQDLAERFVSGRRVWRETPPMSAMSAYRWRTYCEAYVATGSRADERSYSPGGWGA